MLVICLIYSKEYRYVEYAGTDCLTGSDLGDSHDQEICKTDCAYGNNCGGYVLAYGECFTKGLNCKENLVTQAGAITYIKEKN